MPHRQIHFVTGRLAAPALHQTLERLAPQVGFDYSLEVLPISVAALMTPAWIARHWHVPPAATEVLLPGYAAGDPAPLAESVDLPIAWGPKDLHELPAYFGRPPLSSAYGAHDIEILAEINHAPRLSLEAILSTALRWRQQGADLIDLGCDPGATWSTVGDTVSALRDQGCRVSVDSMNVQEIQAAVDHGAELVLSVNSRNRHAAPDWGCEVVAIPDDPASLAGLDATMEFLDQRRVPFRIDPILEPIGFGFAASLLRYAQLRQRFPAIPMLMGIGNLTELTDCDSAGINLLLLAWCQELHIHSVLTTEVINWARSSVQECHQARRLVHYAVRHRALPKHVAPELVMLRDVRLVDMEEDELRQLAAAIRDHNYRLFATRGKIHAVTRDQHVADGDAFQLFDQLARHASRPLDPHHAFYLGYEMCKATIALTLGKHYRQDEALDWGLLSVPEPSHRVSHTTRLRPQTGSE